MELAGGLTRVGNRTECALLQLAADLGGSVDGLRGGRRSMRTFPFTSERKRMSTVIGGRARHGHLHAPLQAVAVGEADAAPDGPAGLEHTAGHWALGMSSAR